MPIVCLICGTAGPGRVPLCHTHRERWRRWGSPPVEDWATRFRENRLSVCCICGEPFNGYRNRTTCPEKPACELERRRRAGLANYYARPAERKRREAERSTARSREKRESRKGPRTCGLCETTFVGYPHAKLCSPGCRAIARNQKSAECRAIHRAAEKMNSITLAMESRNGGDASPETPASNPRSGDGT